MKNDIQTKLNATEVVVKLIKNWQETKSVIIFTDVRFRVKATKKSNSEEILLTFGKPNYREKELYKKSRVKGKTSLTLVIPEKKAKKK